eukprot:5410968-Prymnesium_polylepis.1
MAHRRGGGARQQREGEPARGPHLGQRAHVHLPAHEAGARAQGAPEAGQRARHPPTCPTSPRQARHT